MLRLNKENTTTAGGGGGSLPRRTSSRVRRMKAGGTAPARVAAMHPAQRAARFLLAGVLTLGLVPAIAFASDGGTGSPAPLTADSQEFVGEGSAFGAADTADTAGASDTSGANSGGRQETATDSGADTIQDTNAPIDPQDPAAYPGGYPGVQEDESGSHKDTTEVGATENGTVVTESSATGEQADPGVTDNTVTADSASATETNQPSGDVMPLGDGAPVRADFARLGDVSLGGTNDTYSLTMAQAANPNNTATLEVKVAFSAANVSKQIRITLGQGLGLYAAPGMVASNTTIKDNWTFNRTSNPLPSQNEGITAGTWTRGAQLTTPVSYQTRAGTLVYDVTPDDVAFTLQLIINRDRPFILNYDGISFVDAIKVETIENGVIRESATLENYQIQAMSTTATLAYEQLRNDDMVVYSAVPGGTWVASRGFYIEPSTTTGGFSPYDADAFLYQTINLRYKIAKALGYQNVTLPSGITPYYSIDSAAIDTAASSADPAFDYLDMVIKPLQVRPYNEDRLRFTFTGQPQASGQYAAVVGQTYNISCVEASITSISNQTIPNARIGKSGTNAIVILDPTVTDANVEFLNLERSTMPEAEWGGPGEIHFLGNIEARNNTQHDATGWRVQLSFTDPGIGVKTVHAMVGPGGAKDIRITTTTGAHNGTLADYPSYSATNYPTIAPTLEADEYLTSLSYTTTITSQQRTHISSSSYMGRLGYQFSIYGKLLSSVPAAYSYTATFLKPTTTNPADATADNPAHWASGASRTYTITPLQRTLSQYGVRYSNDASLQSLLAGGAAKAMTCTPTSYQHYYGTSYLQAYKGLDFYVREPEGLLVDVDSLKVTWNGRDYYPTVKSGYTDSTGCRYWKIAGDDVIIGIYKNASLADYGWPKISVDISAKVTTPTRTYSSGDIFFWVVRSTEVPGTLSNGTITQDIWGMTGSFTNRIGRGDQSQVFTTTAQIDLLAQTAADKGDGNWQSYNPNASIPANTIINLNTATPARFKVDIANNSGNPARSYAIIIPIPKIGESAGANFQTADFQWSAYLDSTSEVHAALVQQGFNAADFTVSYATSYPSTVGDAAWSTWDAIANKADIRAVMVTYIGVPIPDGTSQSFYMSIKMPQGAEAQAAQGKINQYSARLYKDLGDALVGYRTSAPVSLKLNTGIVSGKVVLDGGATGIAGGGKNGSYDATDSGVANMVVRAYAAGTSTLLDETITAADGTYRFVSLSSTQAVDIEFVNPGTTVAPLRFVQPAISTNDSYKVTNITPSVTTGYNALNVLLQAPWALSFVAPGYSGVTALPATQWLYPGQTATEPGASNTPALAGYAFTAWYASTTASDNTLFNFTTAFAATTGDKTAYARFSANQVKVTYHDNYPTFVGGGSTATPTPWPTYGTAISAPNPAPTLNGYSFSGWYTHATTQDVTTAWSFANLLTTANGVTGADTTTPQLDLYAKWTEKASFAVTYDLNGATSAAIVQKTGVKWSDVDLLPATAPTRTGYTLAGWNVSVGGSVSGVTAANSYASLADAGTEPLTLTLQAQWTANQYTISYNPVSNSGSGSGSLAATTATYGQSVTLAAASGLTAPGPGGAYEFFAWATSVDGSGTHYSDAQTFTYTLSSNITLFAIWRVTNTNHIYFNANGGDVASLTNLDYNSTQTIPTIGVTRDGYSFAGWKTTANGASADFGNAGDSFNVDWTGSKTVYAHWTANQYLVSYNGNGSTGSTAGLPMGNGTPTYSSSFTLAANSYTRTGYTFTGWATSDADAATGTVTYQDEATINPYLIWDAALGTDHEGDLALFAVWTLDHYTVTFEGNGGSPSSSTLDVTYSAALGSFPIVQRTGYVLSGWFTVSTATGGVQWRSGDIYAITDSLSLYARWTPKTYAVTYDANGGSGTAMDAGLATFDSNFTLAGNSYTRTGYTFTGWATSAADAATGTLAYQDLEQFIPWNLDIAGGSGATGGSLGLFAVWQPKSYTLVYDGNGADGGLMSSSNVTYDQNFQLVNASCSRTGYIFQGWATSAADAAAGIVAYPNQAQFNPWRNDVSGGIYTLYAVWAAKPHTITFNAGAQGTINGAASFSVDLHYDDALPAAPVPTRTTGWQFSGWQPAYPAGGTVSDNATYTAQWSALNYSVVYHSSGHTFGSVPAPTTHQEGTTASIIGAEGLARSGYTFRGWDTSASATFVVYAQGASLPGFSADLNLYAVWTLNPVVTPPPASTYSVSYAPGAPAGEVTGMPEPLTGLAQGSTVSVGAAPAREGYTFKGWASPSGGLLAAASSLTVEASDVILTATWEKIPTFTLTYQSNGATSGTAPSDTHAYRSGESATVAAAGTLAKTGFIFKGWATSANATSARYQAGDSLALSADVSLYAVWEEEVKATETVTSVRAGGTESYTQGGQRITQALREELDDSALALIESQTGDLLADLAQGRVAMGGFQISAASARSLASLVGVGIGILLALVALASLASRRLREKRYLALALGAVLLALGAVVILVVLEDFSAPLTWLTQSTIPVALVVAAELVVILLWFVLRKKERA